MRLNDAANVRKRQIVLRAVRYLERLIQSAFSQSSACVYDGLEYYSQAEKTLIKEMQGQGVVEDSSPSMPKIKVEPQNDLSVTLPDIDSLIDPENSFTNNTNNNNNLNSVSNNNVPSHKNNPGGDSTGPDDTIIDPETYCKLGHLQLLLEDFPKGKMLFILIII